MGIKCSRGWDGVEVRGGCQWVDSCSGIASVHGVAVCIDKIHTGEARVRQGA